MRLKEVRLTPVKEGDTPASAPAAPLDGNGALHRPWMR